MAWLPQSLGTVVLGRAASARDTVPLPRRLRRPFHAGRTLCSSKSAAKRIQEVDHYADHLKHMELDQAIRSIHSARWKAVAQDAGLSFTIFGAILSGFLLGRTWNIGSVAPKEVAKEIGR